jgi:hypothetical protein
MSEPASIEKVNLELLEKDELAELAEEGLEQLYRKLLKEVQSKHVPCIQSETIKMIVSENRMLMKDLADSLSLILSRLQLIFGGHILINGQWFETKEQELKEEKAYEAEKAKGEF